MLSSSSEFWRRWQYQVSDLKTDAENAADTGVLERSEAQQEYTAKYKTWPTQYTQLFDTLPTDWTTNAGDMHDRPHWS